MRKILDLCCGRVPWVARNFVWKQDGVGTKLSDRFSSVPKRTLYLCVDNDASVISQGKKLVADIANMDSSVFCGQIEFRRSDARKLSLPPESFDIVILADFVNVPAEDYNYGGERASVGLSEEIKREILEKAILLLKPNGQLIVAFYETPQYAECILENLTDKESRLVLVEQFGGVSETWGRGKRCLCELVFQKTSQKTKPRRVPINKKQRAYLQNLATEDESLDLGDHNDLFDRGLI